MEELDEDEKRRSPDDEVVLDAFDDAQTSEQSYCIVDLATAGNRVNMIRVVVYADSPQYMVNVPESIVSICDNRLIIADKTTLKYVDVTSEISHMPE